MVLAWNESAVHLFGRNAGDAIGSPLARVIGLPPHVCGDSGADWRRLAESVGAGPDDALVLLATDRDGDPQPVQVRIQPTAADGRAVVRFHPAATVEQPRPDDELFRVIFERAPEAITVLDADRRQVMVNPAGLRLVGLPSGMEQIGHGEVYIHPDDLRLFEERGRQLDSGEQVEVGPLRYRVAHADGSWRWLESLSVDLRDVPAVGGFVVLSRDVTEAEEQRVALEEATAQLGQLDRARNDLLSVVSHELRTPLSAILSASEHLAADPVDADETRAYAQLIHRNAQRLDGMVADLLLIGRLRTGSLPVDLGPVDVGAVVAEVAAAHLTPSGPAVRVEIGTGPPARADAERLAQVVANLVTNAVKFGGASDVTVTAQHGADHWTLTVSDDGPGVDPAETEHLFDPFVRAAGTSVAGNGLGLAIARGIVELHDGTIELRPGTGGRGTDAVVRIPDWPEDIDGR